jgi:Flp pilus assembly protein TadD
VRTLSHPACGIAALGLVAAALCGCVGPQSRVDVAAEQRAATSPAALARIADAAAQSGDAQAAGVFYKRAVILDPGKIDNQIKYAGTLTMQGHADDAIEQLTRVQATAPGNSKVAATLGKLLVLAHRAGPATAVFRTALNTHPNDMSLLVGLGVALDADQNPVAAQEIYRRVLATEPHSLAARNDLALSLALSGHPTDALDQFRMLRADLSSSDAPQSSLATVAGNLALTYGLQGDMRNAAQTAAASLTPADLAGNLRFYSALAPAAPVAAGPARGLPAAPAVSPDRPPAATPPPA